MITVRLQCLVLRRYGVEDANWSHPIFPPVTTATILAARNLFPPPRPRGVCQSQALVLRIAPGSSHGLINVTKVTVSLVHQRGGGTSFFVFPPIFPNWKNHISSQRVDFRNRIRKNKKGGVTSRHVFGPYIRIFFLAGITQRPVLREKRPSAALTDITVSLPQKNHTERFSTTKTL